MRLGTRAKTTGSSGSIGSSTGTSSGTSSGLFSPPLIQKKIKGKFSTQADHGACFSRSCYRQKKLLIYGATGYTGNLTVRRAWKLGMQPILAGRSRARLQALAEPFGFEYRVASNEDRYGLDLAIRDVDVVLNIAGPFSRTASSARIL